MPENLYTSQTACHAQLLPHAGCARWHVACSAVSAMGKLPASTVSFPTHCSQVNGLVSSCVHTVTLLTLNASVRSVPQTIRLSTQKQCNLLAALPSPAEGMLGLVPGTPCEAGANNHRQTGRQAGRQPGGHVVSRDAGDRGGSPLRACLLKAKNNSARRALGSLPSQNLQSCCSILPCDTPLSLDNRQQGLKPHEL